MFCTKCGNQLDDGARFCTRCGAPLGAPTVRRLYMDAKGLTLFNYKFEIRDEVGNLRYLAATVTESMFTYNARIYNLDGSEAMAIHQQKKMTMAAMNFDIVDPRGMLVTEAMQKMHFTNYNYELPRLGISVRGNFLALNFAFYRGEQSIGKVSKKMMAWGDCYEVEFVDPALEMVFLSMVMVIQLVIAASRNRRR